MRLINREVADRIRLRQRELRAVVQHLRTRCVDGGQGSLAADVECLDRLLQDHGSLVGAVLEAVTDDQPADGLHGCPPSDR